MSVVIKELGVTIPGKVVRNYTEAGNETTLVLDESQAQSLYDSLGPVLDFFASQKPQLVSVKSVSSDPVVFASSPVAVEGAE